MEPRVDAISISSQPTVPQKGDHVRVLYVDPKDAKTTKTRLEEMGMLNKDFRMTSSTHNDFLNCIAIPLIAKSINTSFPHYFTEIRFAGEGNQFCNYSTSLLGNHMQRHPRKDGEAVSSPTLIQRALHETCVAFLDQWAFATSKESLHNQIFALSIVICPKNLELLGDDNTVVINRKSFDVDDMQMRALLQAIGCGASKSERAIFLKVLWEKIALNYKSARVVRKGEVDPESEVRQSGYRLLWPFNGVPSKSGPGSAGWITVTEQGIRQSFDLTRVMFSRGNITEKIRFGQLVQSNEIVLDLYAGIGYFTLPALVHGQAEYVYACEWNKHAVVALQHNILDNEVENRVTVLQGDCRLLAKEHNLVDMFDRVSLGLLPSSEGGWRTAVRALRRTTGGWLHVHGNVPVQECFQWATWLCQCLYRFVTELGMGADWAVLCDHVEKVKSFAPTVNHYVADVFVGPPSELGREGVHTPAGTCTVIQQDQTLVRVPLKVMYVPTCALSPGGVLNQEWMREGDHNYL
jgi:tRNA G37 N-methylase Trm5